MSYPHADTASLVNYYLASKHVERYTAEWKANARALIEELLQLPNVPSELAARARALLESDGDE